jgi:hypothetical protein
MLARRSTYLSVVLVAVDLALLTASVLYARINVMAYVVVAYVVLFIVLPAIISAIALAGVRVCKMTFENDDYGFRRRLKEREFRRKTAVAIYNGMLTRYPDLLQNFRWRD